jgi:hypothetical protein
MRDSLNWLIVLALLAAAAPGAGASTAPAATAAASTAGIVPTTSAAPAEPGKIKPPDPEATLVLSQWHSLFVNGKKIGYIAQNLFTLAGGGRRLETKQFLRATLASEKFGYSKIITADVDAKFRPVALQCQVSTPDRQWEVTGRREDRELVLTRKVGSATATTRIAVDDETTFLTWAMPATLLGGARAGETHRWTVIDESLGALAPDPCQVRMLGSRAGTGGLPGGAPEAMAVLVAHGVEQVIHVVGPDGRTVRSLWQTAPMVAEATSLTEARRIAGAGPGMPGIDIEGLDAGQYKSDRLGLVISIPGYPYVTHVVPDLGMVVIENLMDESAFVLRPASAPRPPAAGPLPDAEAARLADLLQHEWAARFEDVKAEPMRAKAADKGTDAQVRWVTGTARLGCTTLHFRNQLLPGEGLAWLVTATAIDGPMKDVLFDRLMDSVKLSAPEGTMPVQLAGDIVRSPAYGFQLRRPGKNWQLPLHTGGPMTVLELAREDGAAVAIVRVAKPHAGQSLEAYAAEQAASAAENLGVKKPEPAATTLAGEKAVQISYEGAKILSGDPARCTAVFTQFGSKIFSLVLVVRSDADPTAATDVQAVRESLTFAKATAAAN